MQQVRLIKSKFCFSMCVSLRICYGVKRCGCFVSKQCSSSIFGKFLLVHILAHVFRMSKREQRTKFYNAVIVVLSYVVESQIWTLLPASKNEYKQTVASEESQIEQT